MEKSRSTYLYLVLTILFWSAAPAVAKLVLGELDNYQLLFWSSIVGVISLFIVNIAQGKLKLLFTYTKKDYLIMFGMGFLGIFLYNTFLYGSFALAPAGQANVINYLWPVFVIIFSIPILKEKFNYVTLLAVFVSFSGALIAITKGNILVFTNEYAFGYLLAALGAVCYGLFSVLGKKLEYEKCSSMLVYTISATIFITLATLLFSHIAIPTTATTIISILVLGGLINSIAFVFWFKALQFGHTHTTANIIYSVPFIAMIWTYFLNSEPFAAPSIIGLMLIAAGVIIQFKNKI